MLVVWDAITFYKYKYAHFKDRLISLIKSLCMKRRSWIGTRAIMSLCLSQYSYHDVLFPTLSLWKELFWYQLKGHNTSLGGWEKRLEDCLKYFSLKSVLVLQLNLFNTIHIANVYKYCRMFRTIGWDYSTLLYSGLVHTFAVLGHGYSLHTKNNL